MVIASPRAAFNDGPQPPDWQVEDIEDWKRVVSDTIDQLRRGQLPITGTVTLTNSQTTTILTDSRIGIDSVLLFTPTTEDARTQGSPSCTAKGKETATLTHASASTTRTYDYIVIGV